MRSENLVQNESKYSQCYESIEHFKMTKKCISCSKSLEHLVLHTSVSLLLLPHQRFAIHEK